MNELNAYIPIFLALLAYAGWGIGDAISIKLFRNNNPSIVTVQSGLGRILIWVLMLPLFFQNIGIITIIPLAYNLIAGLSSGLGYYFYGKAARITNPSLVAAISGAWGGSALVFSLLFFNESISLNQWISISLIFLGLLIVTFNFRLLKKVNITNDKGIAYSLLAFVAWGVCGALLKIPALAYGWYWTSIIMLLPYTLVLLFEIKENRKALNFKVKNVWLFVSYVLLIALADLGYNGSFQAGGDVSMVGTIAGSYATLSTYLAYKLYKEPLSFKQKIGILISLIGIVLTSYFSSK